MAEKVHHSEGAWGWAKVGRGELVALASASPHDCNERGCPGPVNKRRIEAFEELLAALEAILTDQDDFGWSACRWCGRDFEAGQVLCTSDDCRGFIARAAIAKAKGN